MKSAAQTKRITLFLFITVVLICLSISPNGFGVTPPPDGAYPHGNTAEGQSALLSLSTGGFNTAVGFVSLESVTTASFNTAVGAGTLLANTADSNTAVGTGSLLSNTTGGSNTSSGAFALFSNSTGDENTATGAFALTSSDTGIHNTATGFRALANTLTASENTATAANACPEGTTGSENTATGAFALTNNTTGSENTAVGASAGSNVTTADNVICIGFDVRGQNISNSCFIGNIRGVTTQNANAIPVLIDTAGQLGTQSSSRRFKEQIKTMERASEAILALRPVTFEYKSDETNTPQFGLIAEEVGEVNPDLVVRDKNGEIYSVRYDAVNAMLLNEFLKEHRKVQKLEATVTQQRNDFRAAIAKLEETLAVQIKQQSAQVQRVSAQIEMIKAASQLVANKP